MTYAALAALALVLLAQAALVGASYGRRPRCRRGETCVGGEVVGWWWFRKCGRWVRAGTALLNQTAGKGPASRCRQPGGLCTPVPPAADRSSCPLLPAPSSSLQLVRRPVPRPPLLQPER